MDNQAAAAAAAAPPQDPRLVSTNVRTYIEGLRPFWGESADLLRFLTEVEQIIPALADIHVVELQIRFRQILSKIMGEARVILDEKPTEWLTVRTLLIQNFSDRTDLGTQLSRMEQIPYLGSIYKTYLAIARAQTRMLDKIELSSDTPAEKTLMIGCVTRKSYQQFRKCLPQACQGALTSRQCSTIITAIQILHDEDFLTYDRYYEDRRQPRASNRGNVTPIFNRNQGNSHYQTQNQNSRPGDRHQNNNRGNYQNNNRGNYQNNNRGNYQNSHQIRMGNQYGFRPQYRDNHQPNNFRGTSQRTRQSQQNNFAAPVANLNAPEPMEIEQNFQLRASEQETLNSTKKHTIAYPTYGSTSEDWDTR